GRDRAVRAPLLPGDGPQLDRARRGDRRARLGGLLADVPAGDPGHARPTSELAVRRRAPPTSWPAARRSKRAALALGGGGPGGHAPAVRGADPRPRRPLHPRLAVLP